MNKVLVQMYALKNLGDDLFLKRIAEEFPNTMFYVYTSVKYTKETFPNNVKVRCNRIINVLRRIKVKYIGQTKKFDAYVWIGGSIFIELKESRSELGKRLRHIFPKNKPCFIIGSNFGPYKNDYYKEEHERFFDNVSDITFRDSSSIKMFHNKKNMNIYPDVVFGMDISRYQNEVETKSVLISVINLEDRPALSKYKDLYEEQITQAADYYSKSGYNVVLMSFCSYEKDHIAIGRIMNKLDSKNVKKYIYDGNIEEALKVVASSSIVIGSRFHSIVLGLLFKKKVLPIIYSEKTVNMLMDLGYNGDMVDLRNMKDKPLYAYRLATPMNESKYRDITKKSKHHFDSLRKVLSSNDQL